MSDIRRLFEWRLRERNLDFQEADAGRYLIEVGSGKIAVSLDNVERNYLRDNDTSAIDRFIDTLLQPILPLPEWPSLRDGLLLSLEPNDLEGLDDTIRMDLSDSVAVVLTYYSTLTGHMRWLQPRDLENLAISVDEGWQAAESNLERVLSTTSIAYSDIGGQKLGMIEAEEPYKASLILARGLREKVEASIGWPIYAVAPARDFVYLFSRDGGLIDRVGKVVVDEYQASGYPISTEVWELSDNGRSAIGAFPTE